MPAVHNADPCPSSKEVSDGGRVGECFKRVFKRFVQVVLLHKQVKHFNRCLKQFI